MVRSLEFKGLRGLELPRTEGWAPITVLVGPNGCGKSTVVEALGVACAGGDPRRTFDVLASREWLGLSSIELWLGSGAEVTATFDSDVFGSYDGIRLRLTLEAGTHFEHEARRAGLHDPYVALAVDATPTRGETSARVSSVTPWVLVDEDGVVRLTLDERSVDPVPFSLQAAFVERAAGARNRLSGRFSSALRNAMTAIKLSPWYDDLVEYLRVLRPNLASIESLAVGERDEPFVFERDPRRVYPLAYAGDGFRRALLIAAKLAEAKGGIVGLDEPEAFAHPRMFEVLAKLIHRATNDDTEVIIATHSLEFTGALLAEVAEHPDRASVIALNQEAGVIDPVVIAGPDAHRRVVELSDDLRL